MCTSFVKTTLFRYDEIFCKKGTTRISQCDDNLHAWALQYLQVGLTTFYVPVILHDPHLSLHGPYLPFNSEGRKGFHIQGRLSPPWLFCSLLTWGEVEPLYLHDGLWIFRKAMKVHMLDNQNDNWAGQRVISSLGVGHFDLAVTKPAGSLTQSTRRDQLPT